MPLTTEQKTARLAELELALIAHQDKMIKGVLEIEDDNKRLRQVSYSEMERIEAKIQKLIADLQSDLGITPASGKATVGRFSPKAVSA